MRWHRASKNSNSSNDLASSIWISLFYGSGIWMGVRAAAPNNKIWLLLSHILRNHFGSSHIHSYRIYNIFRRGHCHDEWDLRAMWACAIGLNIFKRTFWSGIMRSHKLMQLSRNIYWTTITFSYFTNTHTHTQQRMHIVSNFILIDRFYARCTHNRI